MDKKINEITHLPELLKSIELNDTIVTWDTLNTQKGAVAAVIREKAIMLGF